MKVSILIPVYNSSSYLAQTIESALAQTWENKEIIIVDDGSTDESLSIALSYASDIVKIFSQTNAGACRARNRAFSESCGDYIQYLDADDLLSKEKIENQMKLISDTDSNAVISCSWVRFRNNLDVNSSKVIPQSIDHDWADPLDWLMSAWEGKGMGQTSIWLTPRHLVEKAGPWNESLSINQDGEFFSRVLLAAASIKYSRESIVHYRSGIDNSISGYINETKATSLLHSYLLYQQHMLNRMNHQSRMQQALARNYFSFIYTYCDQYPSLAEEAFQYIDSLNVLRPVAIGGRQFRWLSDFFGFRNALVIRGLARRLATKFNLKA